MTPYLNEELYYVSNDPLPKRHFIIDPIIPYLTIKKN